MHEGLLKDISIYRYKHFLSFVLIFTASGWLLKMTLDGRTLAKKAFRPWHTEKVRIQLSCLICLFFLNISFSSSLPFIFIHNLGFWNIFDFSEVDNLKTTSTFFSEWMPSFSKSYKSWFSFKTYLYLLVRYCTSANNWSVLLFLTTLKTP